MMRGGVLLAEESPENLMARCNTSTLEEAFLTLSYKQETSSNIQVHNITVILISYYINTIWFTFLQFDV